MGKATQPVSIEGIEFDALIGSTEGFSAKSPDYPIEDGFSVQDTIILDPETLDLTLFLSNRPVTWAKRLGNSPGRVEDVAKRLKELYFKKQLITVVTSTTTYTDMAISTLSLPKTNSMMESMEVGLQLKKIRTTETRMVTIPDSYGKSGESEKSAGTASTSKGSSSGSSSGSAASSGSSGAKQGTSSGGSTGSQKSGSILYTLANGAGLLK